MPYRDDHGIAPLHLSHRADRASPTDTSPLALSIVVPCYNEQDVLLELHKRVTPVARAVAGSQYELVLVDDGSRDLTWPLIVSFAKADPCVVGVRLARNHGHQLALSSGLAVARGDRVLVLDADLQDPPELLPDMMMLMDEQAADVVYGQRAQRLGETWFKRKSAAAFYRLLGYLADTPIPQDTGDFRLMSRRVLDLLNEMPEQFRFIRGLVSWVGFRQVPLVYQRRERFAGVTKYPLKAMLRFAVDAITSFSIRPLRLAMSLAGVVAGIGVACFAYATLRWMEGRTVPGWTSIVAATSIFASVQLLVLGIIGEYLGRLYIESKRRPLFIIEQVLRAPARTTGAEVPVASALGTQDLSAATG